MQRKKWLALGAVGLAAVLVAWGGWAYFFGGRGEGEFAPPLETPSESVAFPAPNLTDSYREAKAANGDTMGWLYIPSTTVNEAVVQVADNETYLRRNALKKYSYAGSLFLDYRADPKTTQNSVIYGHNLGSPMGRKDDPEGEKFAQLLKFENQTFAEQTPYLYFQVGEEQQVYQVFSVFYSEAYTSPVEYHHDQYTPGEYTALLQDLKDRSLFDYQVEVGAEDRLLTLSTCSYKYGTYSQNADQRFVVVGRLVGQGESYQPTAALQPNPDPKAPDFSGRK